MFDVIVIGGGVIGGAILRELTKYKCEVCLLERENDVCMGQSKANSGIVHAGFDAAEGTNKARFNVRGNALMPAYAAQLGVKYKNIGSLVVAFSDGDLGTLVRLKERGEKNGVPGLELVDRKRLRELEPNISEEAVGALFAPTGGIVCPYGLTIAEIGNAMDNGARLYCNFEVTSVRREKDSFVVGSADGREVRGRVAVNCAGLGAGKVSALFGDDGLCIGGRRGEYLLLDRADGDFVSHTLFFTPTRKGKGVLVSPTADGNLLLGPTAEEVEDGGTQTTQEGIASVIAKAAEMCRGIPFRDVITSFAGVRAYSQTHDFIIGESERTEGLFQCAGIESPGLTSAPAIAEYLVGTLLRKKLKLEKNPLFDGTRKPDHFFKDLSVAEQNALIREDPAYGKIVCRCEQITEGEIVRAIRKNPPARDVDAVKRRTRAGMGRCQGGFCQPHVAELLSRELGIPFDEVTKSGAGSELLKGVSK